MKIQKLVRKLLMESLEKELVDYANQYIEKNSCDKIYEDLSKFQTAVNGGKIQISDNDKKELDKNLIRFKNEVVDASFLKQKKCNFAKGEMKKEFEKQSRENSEYLRTTMCWFAENIIKDSKLNSCQKVENNKETILPQNSEPKQKLQTVPIPTANQPITSKKTFDFETWEF